MERYTASGPSRCSRQLASLIGQPKYTSTWWLKNPRACMTPFGTPGCSQGELHQGRAVRRERDVLLNGEGDVDVLAGFIQRNGDGHYVPIPRLFCNVSGCIDGQLVFGRVCGCHGVTFSSQDDDFLWWDIGCWGS